jgi:long-chain acyl-CoA synthetase
MEIRRALSDSGTAVLFTDDETLAGAVPLVRSLSADYERLLTESEEADFAEVGPGTVASLVYTGGTTGRAKGVMLTHGNVTANARTWPSAWPLSSLTRWALIAPMSHLAGTNAVLTTVRDAGSHIVLPFFSAEGALDLIERERVTATLIVPSMLAAMVEEQALRPRNTSSLRYLSHGGAPIAAETLRRAHQVFPAAELMEIYGTTETAPNITFLPGEQHLLEAPEIHSCGRAVPGMEVAVVDGDGQLVPDGHVGEVTVRGPLVMAGYWEKPDVTAAAVVGGWYHTGDIGRLDPRGYLYLLDRKNDIINTGGESVYSSEVEEVLYRHPQVLEAAVFGIPSAKWGEAVHAVVRRRGPVNDTELLEHCARYVARFKAPKEITFVAEPLPKSAAGKILKHVLREPYWADHDKRISGV